VRGARGETVGGRIRVEPGGICISGIVREHVGNRLTLGYEDFGTQPVKNIAEPVRVHRVLPEASAVATLTRDTQRLVRVARVDPRALAHFGSGSCARTMLTSCVS
jgi:hypothetical protein